MSGDIKMAPRNKLTFTSANTFVLKQDGSRVSRSHLLPLGGIRAAEREVIQPFRIVWIIKKTCSTERAPVRLFLLLTPAPPKTLNYNRSFTIKSQLHWPL